MDEKQRRENEAIEKAQELIEKFSERVMVPKMLAPKAELDLFGQKFQGRALPSSFAKRLSRASKELNDTISQILADIAQIAETDRGAYRSPKAIGLADAADDVLTDCVLIITEFYQLPGIDRAKINDTYTVSQKKQIVTFQIELNETEDFLLVPLRLSLNVITNVALLSGQTAGTTPSPARPSSTPTANPGA